MSYQPYPTGTMLIPSGMGSGSHLFIVVTKICADGMHLLYSVSSIKPGVSYDKTCEFVGGEHGFITKPSYVYYRKPDRLLSSSISKLADKNYYVVKGDLDQAHFKRVCEGIAQSPFTTPATLRYFEANRP